MAKTDLKLREGFKFISQCKLEAMKTERMVLCLIRMNGVGLKM